MIEQGQERCIFQICSHLKSSLLWLNIPWELANHEYFLYVLLGANSMFCQESSESEPYQYWVTLTCQFVSILGRLSLWATDVKFKWTTGHKYIILEITLAFRYLLYQLFLLWAREVKKIYIKTSKWLGTNTRLRLGVQISDRTSPTSCQSLPCMHTITHEVMNDWRAGTIS